MAEKFYTVLLPEEVSKRKILDYLKTFDGVYVLFSNSHGESVIANFTKTENGYREEIREFTSNKVLFDITHDKNPYFVTTTIQIAVGRMGSMFSEVKSKIRAFMNGESLMRD